MDDAELDDVVAGRRLPFFLPPAILRRSGLKRRSSSSLSTRLFSRMARDLSALRSSVLRAPVACFSLLVEGSRAGRPVD